MALNNIPVVTRNQEGTRTAGGFPVSEGHLNRLDQPCVSPRRSATVLRPYPARTPKARILLASARQPGGANT
jgi:hypothetical protein